MWVGSDWVGVWIGSIVKVLLGWVCGVLNDWFRVCVC